jgi:hypothetical protein
MNTDNFTLILFFIIIMFILYKYNDISEGIRNTSYFDNDANYQYVMDIEKNKTCGSFNCQNNNNQDQEILLVGKDSNDNHIFQHNNQLYTIINDKLVLHNDDDENNKILYFEYPTKVPANLSDLTLKVKMFFDGYNYVGVLSNNYYNQEYLLYEKPYKLDDTMDDKLYYYILVKILNGKYTKMFELPPRQKILPEEYIWASYGSFQIGPLLFN